MPIHVFSSTKIASCSRKIDSTHCCLVFPRVTYCRHCVSLSAVGTGFLRVRITMGLACSWVSCLLSLPAPSIPCPPKTGCFHFQTQPFESTPTRHIPPPNTCDWASVHLQGCFWHPGPTACPLRCPETLYLCLEFVRLPGMGAYVYTFREQCIHRYLSLLHKIPSYPWSLPLKEPLL